MNIIPSELIAVPRYHGYFWHPVEQVVYSIKVGGVLKKLKERPAYRNSYQCFPAGFYLSNKGRRRRVARTVLRELTPSDYKVPYEHEVRSRI